MKPLYCIIFLCVILIMGLASCPPSTIPLSDQAEPNQIFPDFLAGTWKAQNSNWEFTFESDGSISSMTHFGGMFFKIAEGGLTEKWRDNIEALYILGPCEAQYNPYSRELKVSIIIEHFHVDFPTGALEGNFDDKLWGPVSEENLTWKTIWRSYGSIEGADPMDPNNIPVKTEIFLKIK